MDEDSNEEEVTVISDHEENESSLGPNDRSRKKARSSQNKRPNYNMLRPLKREAAKLAIQQLAGVLVLVFQEGVRDPLAYISKNLKGSMVVAKIIVLLVKAVANQLGINQALARNEAYLLEAAKLAAQSEEQSSGEAAVGEIPGLNTNQPITVNDTERDPGSSPSMADSDADMEPEAEEAQPEVEAATTTTCNAASIPLQEDKARNSSFSRAAHKVLYETYNAKTAGVKDAFKLPQRSSCNCTSGVVSTCALCTAA